MQVSSLEFLEQSFLWLENTRVAAGWKRHFLSQSKEKEIYTLRKGEETKPSKLRAERGRIQLHMFWLKLFLRICLVCLVSALVLTCLLPVCKNLSLSVPVGFFVLFWFDCLFWFDLFYYYYLSHAINSSKNALCIQSAVQMYLCCQCATADTIVGGHLAACPERSPPGFCQDFRHRTGKFFCGAVEQVCPHQCPLQKAVEYTLWIAEHLRGNQRPWNPSAISERTGRFFGVN